MRHARPPSNPSPETARQDALHRAARAATGAGALATACFTVVLASCLFAAAAWASDIPRAKRWHEPYVTLLDVNFVDTGFQARWEYFHCGCGDILVRLEQTAPDGVLTGEMLLIDGQVLAARGMVSLSPDLEPMLQSPSIMLHLAFALLERAVPKGPASVTERQVLAADAVFQALELNSGMATGTFPAPWKLTGEAWPNGEGQRRFDMKFEFTNPDSPDPDGTTVFTFTGGQDYRRDDFPFPDEMPLAGWKVQWISKGEAAASDAPDGLTLGALREEALALSRPDA